MGTGAGIAIANLVSLEYDQYEKGLLFSLGIFLK